MGKKFKKDILYEVLKADLLAGKYPPLSKFPNELTFAKQLGVGQVTLRYALSLLKADGLIEQAPAKGTWVTAYENRFSKNKEICIVCPPGKGIQDYAPHVLPGVYQEAVALGFDISNFNADYLRRADKQKFFDLLGQKNVRAIIAMVNGLHGDEEYVQLLQETGLPIMLPNARPGDSVFSGFTSLVVDNYKAWRDAVTYLVELGHHRIGALATKPDRFRECDRAKHLDLMKSIGASDDQVLARDSTFDMASVQLVVDEWLAMSKPPTAILCYSDYFAMYVCDALRVRGKQPGVDMAVMGICGYPEGVFLNPSLTTMDFDYVGLGRKSVEIIAKATESKAEQKRHHGLAVAHPCQLVERESTSLKKPVSVQ